MSNVDFRACLARAVRAAATSQPAGPHVQVQNTAADMRRKKDVHSSTRRCSPQKSGFVSIATSPVAVTAVVPDFLRHSPGQLNSGIFTESA